MRHVSIRADFNDDSQLMSFIEFMGLRLQDEHKILNTRGELIIYSSGIIMYDVYDEDKPNVIRIYDGKAFTCSTLLQMIQYLSNHNIVFKIFFGGDELY